MRLLAGFRLSGNSPTARLQLPRPGWHAIATIVVVFTVAAPVQAQIVCDGPGATVCHSQTEICIAQAALLTHLLHGDTLGTCSAPPPTDDISAENGRAVIGKLESDLEVLSGLRLHPDVATAILVPLLLQLETSAKELGLTVDEQVTLDCRRCFGECEITTFLQTTVEKVESSATSPSQCVDDICSQCKSRFNNTGCLAICQQ